MFSRREDSSAVEVLNHQRTTSTPEPHSRGPIHRVTRIASAPIGELAELIAQYIERDGRSLNRLAQSSLIDVAYLWRLRHGGRTNPSRDILIRLALALRLEPEELDELLVAANYAPITLRRN